MRHLVLFPLLMVAACGDKDTPTPVPTPSPKPTPTSKPPFTTEQLRDGRLTLQNQMKEADDMVK